MITLLGGVCCAAVCGISLSHAQYQSAAFFGALAFLNLWLFFAERAHRPWMT